MFITKLAWLIDDITDIYIPFSCGCANTVQTLRYIILKSGLWFQSLLWQQILNRDIILWFSAFSLMDATQQLSARSWGSKAGGGNGGRVLFECLDKQSWGRLEVEVSVAENWWGSVGPCLRNRGGLHSWEIEDHSWFLIKHFWASSADLFDAYKGDKRCSLSYLWPDSAGDERALWWKLVGEQSELLRKDGLYQTHDLMGVYLHCRPEHSPDLRSISLMALTQIRVT